MFFTYFTYTLIKITGPRKNKEFAESINKIKTYIKNTKILIKLLKYKLYLSKGNKGHVFIQNQYIQMDKIKKIFNILYKAIDRLYSVGIKKHHMIKQKKRISHIIQKN